MPNVVLIYAKELILLKVIKWKSAWFATIGFLIMDSNFKILKIVDIQQKSCLNFYSDQVFFFYFFYFAIYNFADGEYNMDIYKFVKNEQ